MSLDTLPVVINDQLEEILTVIPDLINKYDQSIRSLWSQGVNEYYMVNQANCMYLTGILENPIN